MTGKSTQWVASPQLLFSLAAEYRRASICVHDLGRKGQPLSLAPFRFTAIHAIELYLSAVLLKGGHDLGSIRELGHDLQPRAELAKKVGLDLRQNTFDHLGALDANREYPVSRYGSENSETTSPENRLFATLNEVAKKTAALFELMPRPATLSR